MVMNMRTGIILGTIAILIVIMISVSRKPPMEEIREVSILPGHKACMSDSDCALVQIQCSPCLQEAVTETYADRYQQDCPELRCLARRTWCDAGTCTSETIDDAN